MRRKQYLEDARLWAIFAATVRPLPGRTVPSLPETAPAAAPDTSPATPRATPAPAKSAPPRKAARPPETIEPRRRRRLVLEREALSGSIDLHGLGQDGARAALTDYLLRGQGEGRRVVLVITGKGIGGDGVLRRRVPEWLAEPPLRAQVAAVSPADRRHGGGGALYVALKPKRR